MEVYTYIGIAVAGALGALARYGVDAFVSERTGGGIPWGTFAVNVSGSFILGLAFTLLAQRYAAPPWVRSTVTVGFVGSYTTFSTLSFQSYRLLTDGEVGLALANLLGSCAAGLVAVYLGVLAARAL
jgi:CrcB protein